MSGHSHWAGIKHKKAITDAKRAKFFTKHGKLITIAARSGGGNPDTNFQLRLAIERARLDNMPKENIERAIKRGTGELKDGTEIQEITYEGMGPGGVMMIIKAATDNRNRTVSELKTIFAKNGGKLGEMGSVMWNFRQVGAIIIKEKNNLEELEMQAIEAGAEDTEYSENLLSVYVHPENLHIAREKLEKAGIKIESAGLAFLPSQKTVLSEKDAAAYEKFLEALDDQDDVQEIYDNL